jgi:hypothetical protein
MNVRKNLIAIANRIHESFPKLPANQHPTEYKEKVK